MMNYLLEDITGLIPKPEEKFVKSPRYNSKHKNRIRSEVASAKKSHQTLGLPIVPLNPPSQFLKKNSRNVPQKHVKHVHYRRPRYQHELPKWKPMKIRPKPELEELPKDPVNLGRINFKKQNILEVKKSRPPEPVPLVVDSRFGDTQDLRKCGWLPMYIVKKYFEKKPSIPKNAAELKKLREWKQRLRSGGAENKESEERKTTKPGVGRYVTEEERAKLLHGMKENWEDMMSQFQRLPFLTDSPSKVRRKVKLENDLKELEKDIEFIERHPYIYVCDDE